MKVLKIKHFIGNYYFIYSNLQIYGYLNLLTYNCDFSLDFKVLYDFMMLLKEQPILYFIIILIICVYAVLIFLYNISLCILCCSSLDSLIEYLIFFLILFFTLSLLLKTVYC